MNNLKLIFFIFFVSVFEAVSSQPIGITKITDMSFGNIAVVSGGTVILDPNSSRSATGGVTLPGVVGTVTAASFNVTGGANLTYTITLPLSYTISSGGNDMTINTFTSTPSATGTLNGAGSQQVLMGATLNVAGAQVSGTYSGGSVFTIIVNYY